MKPDRIFLVIFVAGLIFTHTECRRRRLCRADRGKVYDSIKARCRRCPRCPDGQTKNESYPLNISEQFGAMDCYPCEECPKDHFSNFKETQLVCVECSRNCTEEGRQTKSVCDGKNDAQCGDCLPMFYERTWIAGFLPCLQCSAISKDKPECYTFQYNNPSTERQGTTTQTVPLSSTYDTTATHIGNMLSRVNASVFILVIAVCMAVFFGIVYGVYKCKKLVCSHGVESFGTTSTVEMNSSDGRLHSFQKPLLDTVLTQNDLEVVSFELNLKEEQKNIAVQRGDKFIRLSCRYMDKPADELFDNLNIDRGVRYDAHRRFPQEQREETLEILNHWVSKAAEGATLGRLYEALFKTGYDLICENILKYLQSSNQNAQESSSNESVL